MAHIPFDVDIELVDGRPIARHASPRTERGDAIIAESPAMRRCVEVASTAAVYDDSVLLLGETGSGKERIARLIHSQSPRRAEAFIPVDCGSIGPSVIERELFGHLRGAYTDAHKDSPGLFEAAQGGTLFFDEIGDLPLDLQPKLLRVLQERRVRRLGSTTEISCNVRVIAATCKPLAHLVKMGGFRQDLFFRLAVLPIELPPLRERPEDVSSLIDVNLDTNNRKRESRGIKAARLGPAARRRLEAYSWPGNVRELQNVIARLVLLASSQLLRARDVDVALHAAGSPFPSVSQQTGTIDQQLDRFEKRIIDDAVALHGSQAKAAVAIGLGKQQVLQKRLTRLKHSLAQFDTNQERKHTIYE